MGGEKNITQRKLDFHAKNIRVYLPSLAHIHTSTHKPSHTQTQTHTISMQYVSAIISKTYVKEVNFLDPV